MSMGVHCLSAIELGGWSSSPPCKAHPLPVAGLLGITWSNVSIVAALWLHSRPAQLFKSFYHHLPNSLVYIWFTVSLLESGCFCFESAVVSTRYCFLFQALSARNMRAYGPHIRTTHRAPPSLAPTSSEFWLSSLEIYEANSADIYVQTRLLAPASFRCPRLHSTLHRLSHDLVLALGPSAAKPFPLRLLYFPSCLNLEHSPPYSFVSSIPLGFPLDL
ncbi:hypothetical protein P152DRAFT_296125 [Eremomyces bilateralis CBS 781.70]|uniref:Uncharacterized protein n=1 Tax=Eremomyces bilateralis CBS 781.70 TaxID=1392243 RepID=A0A6G1G723_9PEZI|nr:uncharacterized protein P152DRAFT_296125 [Eremomyces bilateralis CBS 781.70]KAF1813885.1 hypothetical protein P152DRAFT_296125 [Eremomyces bilateralis CBS 781.70]